MLLKCQRTRSHTHREQRVAVAETRASVRRFARHRSSDMAFGQRALYGIADTGGAADEYLARVFRAVSILLPADAGACLCRDPHPSSGHWKSR